MSRNLAKLAVGEFMVGTIGLTLIGFLCILVRKYICDVLGVRGGRQYSVILGDSSDFVVIQYSVDNFYTSSVWSLFNS